MQSSSIQIFSNPQFGQVRTLIIDGEPAAVANDVAECLGYSNPKQAIIDNCEEALLVKSADLLKGSVGLPLNNINDLPSSPYGFKVVFESDIYNLILGSKLPAAKEFKRWIVKEVLPTLRKTGKYEIAPMSEAEQLAAGLVLANRLLAERQQRLLAAEAERDHAIATKAQIGSHREASAMGKASAAVRKLKKAEAELEGLTNRLGEGVQFASVRAVSSRTKKRLGVAEGKQLSAFCRANGLEIRLVLDELYGNVNSYPAAAWQSVFGIDIQSMFIKAY